MVTLSQFIVAVPDTFQAYLWSNGDIDSMTTIFTNSEVWLMVTDPYGCSNRDTINISLWPTGIDDLESQASVITYPNPSNGMITVETPGLEAEALNWSVCNLEGRLISSGSFQSGVSKVRGKIDLQGVASGMYLLSVSSSDTSVSTRVMVQ